MFFLASSLINAATSLILFFLILYKKRSNLNINFAFFCLSVALWSLGYFFWQNSKDYDIAIFWVKFLTIWTVLIPIFYFKFTIVFLELESKINKYLLNSAYFISLFLIFLIPSNLLVKDLERKIYFDFWPNAGILYWLLLLIFLFFVVYSIFLLAKSYKFSHQQRKKQIGFLLIGTGLGFLGGITNFFLWYDIEIPPIGNVLVSLYVILTAYAIIAHKFMDIKLVARQYSVFTASLATILIPAALVQFYSKQIITQYSFIIDIFILGCGVIVFQPLKRYYYDFANKYLFSSLYDSKKVIRSLSDKLRSTIETENIYQYISNTLTATFHSKVITIRIYDHQKHCFSSVHTSGTKTIESHCVSDEFIKSFLNQNEPLLTTEISSSFPEDDFIKSLVKDDFEIILPLTIKDTVVGAILISQKESGEPYNDEDMQVLSVVGAQTAIAIENALLFEEAKKFNATLQNEISIATQKLRLQNEELKKLDQLKTEFISVASHQLRTPLTAMRWGLEFLSSGKKGKLTKGEKETIDDLTQTNNRLIKLVNELLNISRIDEGRLRVDPKPTDLAILIQSCFNDFNPLIEQKKLKLIERYDKLPKINLDETVISKAFINLFSNAIKYSRDKKTLTVQLKIEKSNVILSIQDEGIGIPKKDQENLFKKFYRAANAVTHQTEGNGLGLYIAKSAIEISGGKIWFESQENIGTTFYVSLPLTGSKPVKGEKSLS